MKNIKPFMRIKHFVLSLMLTIISTVYSFAQDKKVDVDINTNSGEGDGFFGSPLIWVVGVAVFILLLVALLRGGRSRSEV